MIVHPVLGAGLACWILQRESRESHAPSIRKNQPCPGDEEPPLPGCYLVVVRAHEARALRDEQHALGPGVVDVPTHLAHDLAGQVGADSGDEDARDNRSRAQRVRRSSGLQSREHRRTSGVASAVEECTLSALAARAGIARSWRQTR